MKLTVNISLDSAAFWTDDGRLNEDEIAHVLGWAKRYATICRDHPLRDSKLNDVGSMKITGRKPKEGA